MAVSVMLAGCESETASEHRGGIIGGVAGAGLGGLVGYGIGRNTTGTLIGAGVGAGLGYIIGNEFDKKKAREGDVAQSNELAGTTWRVQQLNVPNAPAYKEMYLSFQPNNQLVTTTIMPDGQVVRATETYRVADKTLIINRPAQGDQPGYVINAKYNISGDTISFDSPDFTAQLLRIDQLPTQARA
ncbi:MAG: hypothetical protein EHM35_18920 [Planctomycetaceae bacterium]|nr:MAG: hypothetical protein EHM35_18920 [Planctomycetaceae bacterium]